MMTADELADVVELRQGDDGSYAAPEPEGPPPPDFGALLESEDDVDRMMDFLEAMSAHHKVDVDTIQQQAAASNDAWAELMKVYRAWCRKHPVADDAADDGDETSEDDGTLAGGDDDQFLQPGEPA
jgi:hypothetical protein